MREYGQVTKTNKLGVVEIRSGVGDRITARPWYTMSTYGKITYLLEFCAYPGLRLAPQIEGYFLHVTKRIRSNPFLLRLRESRLL